MRPTCVEMTSSLQPGGRRGIIDRPRIVECIELASSRAIVLIIGPAGYGKSIALSQYLRALGGRHTRFNGRNGCHDLLEWTHAALEEFDGTIAVDGLESVGDDILRCIVALIERTKTRIRWILASRSSIGLPTGTWLAYGDCGLAIDAGDLQFTLEESSEAARSLDLNVAEDDLRDVLEFTGGWPVAMSIAFQAFPRSTDRRELHAAIRDASQHFWLEQVYSSIDDHERTLLSVAATLPQIDIGVLCLADFENALQLVEALRKRTGLLSEETNGIYRAPTLFLDFVRHQTALRGTHERQTIHLRAARALETAGRVEAALSSYVAGRSLSNVLRLLESHGFELLERGRSEATSQAIDALDDATRRNSARILALRGVLQSLAGNPVRAEVLLRRSLFRSHGDRDLTASTTLRLALLLTNRGLDIADLVLPIADDNKQSASRRGEALSLLAAQRALAGNKEGAKNVMSRVEAVLPEIDIDSVRAKILQRIGVASVYVGEAEKAREALAQSASLAMELQLYSLASRAYANLSNLMLHRFDDVGWQLWYAEQGSLAAFKAGDAFDVETASLQLLDAELRCGKSERGSKLEDQLAAIRAGDQSRTHYLIPSKALRLAWGGRFADAHRLLAPCWMRLHHDIDRAVSGAQCALYLALDMRRQASVSLSTEIVALLKRTEAQGPFSVRSIAMAHVCCALAEAVNGRFMQAERISRQVTSDTNDAVVALMANVAAEMIAAIRGSGRRAFEAISPLLERLTPLGYAHMAQLMESVGRDLARQKFSGEINQLTRVERATLRLLAEGLSPKEIANRRARSVLTVRTHIANAIWKLRCNGLSQAIALSREMGILDYSNLSRDED
jgi:ATP/maltotriose-dependent transcriptional regulator MalT